MKELKSTLEIDTFVKEHDVFIFDCDGVLWSGSSLFPKTKATLTLLKEHGKQIYFLTNNSSMSREGYAKKFQKKGLEGIDASRIYPSSLAISILVQQKNVDKHKKIFVIGMEGIGEELTEAGYAHVVDAHTYLTEQGVLGKYEEDTIAKILESINPEEYGAVVCGYDRCFENFRLAMASHILLNNKECEFIAACVDSCLPWGAFSLPGTLGVVRAIQSVVDKEADVAGKPNRMILDYILSKNKCADKKCVIIGDRLDTDIKCGNRAGIDTCCVLTGHTKPFMFEKIVDGSPIQPTYIMQGIDCMLTK